nr:flagellar biosynthesis protein FlgG [Helicobacter pylori]
MGSERAVEVKLKESIVIYMLAVFFPWVAFFLRGRIFSAVFSFILWVILCLPIIVAIVATFIPDLREDLGFLLVYGFALQIAWFFGSFLLWVVLTTFVWSCMEIRDKKTWNNLSILLKQTPVNLYTTKHNKQIKPIKHGVWLLFFVFSLV